MRRFMIAALLVLPIIGSIVGCGQADRVVAPFAKTGGTEAGGWAVLGLGPRGTTLRFVPETRFGIGIVLRNRTREEVTLLDVRAMDPPRSLVQEQGTTLLDWNPR